MPPQVEASRFASAHGLAVRAVCLLVEDAAAAHAAALAGGGVSLVAPTPLSGGGGVLCELALYGDVALRLVSGVAPAAAGAGAGFGGSPPSPAPPFLPGYVAPPPGSALASAAAWGPAGGFGLVRLDHAVGNVPALGPALAAVRAMTGFHEFAEFTADQVGTALSGLNSVVLASDGDAVLLPMNEPVHGTPRKSQIATYLEQHPGPGVQHLALSSGDIFATVAAMRRAPLGFDFLPAPGAAYYRAAPGRVGRHRLSDEQWVAVERSGVLVDADERGVLLQVFTAPVGDRATLFLEIIQRVGCEGQGPGGVGQAGGCGGFGKGNFGALFKSVEDAQEGLRV